MASADADDLELLKFILGREDARIDRLGILEQRVAELSTKVQELLPLVQELVTQADDRQGMVQQTELLRRRREALQAALDSLPK